MNNYAKMDGNSPYQCNSDQVQRLPEEQTCDMLFNDV